MELKRYCLIGVKGIGKSSILRVIEKSHPEISVIYGSEILKKIVGKEKFASFDYLPVEEKKKAREEAILFLEKTYSNVSPLIVDGHLTLFDPVLNKIAVVFTEADFNFYTDLILLDSDPNTVQKRRKEDQERKRVTDLNTIKAELENEREKAIILSKKYNLKFHVIYSTNLKQDTLSLLRIIYPDKIIRNIL